MEKKDELHESTIEAIQELIQANLDSADGFSEAARRSDHIQIATLFTELESERRSFSSALQCYVGGNGEKPVNDGTWRAALHRTWIDFRAALSDRDPRVMLIEAIRSETQLKDAYETILRETAGSAVNDVLTRQYAAIKTGHDRITEIRENRDAL